MTAFLTAPPAIGLIVYTPVFLDKNMKATEALWIVSVHKCSLYSSRIELLKSALIICLAGFSSGFC